MKGYNVAVVGATGAVGREMVKVLEERNFSVKSLKLLASERSAGERIKFKGEDVLVEILREDSFKGVEIGLFSPGSKISSVFAPIAAKAGAVVIDNTSYFRMDPDVPLIVPEVNPGAIKDYEKRGIIANPNCSTIQMVVALKPLHDYAKVKRVVVATYQAVSGAGKDAMDELHNQTVGILNMTEVKTKVFPHQIAFNMLPHIDVFLENGYTKEEMKMVNETQKIMGDPSIKVSPTTVRVPVFISHSEAINVEFEKPLSVEKARELLENFPGIVVIDNPEKNEYPMPLLSAGRDEVFVGRIRKDISLENGLNFWCVADNLRKGAATNAVQIAELLTEKYL